MKKTKPPIGLMPEKIWKEERKYNVNLAILRYMEAELPIPIEWVDEYNRLVKEDKQ